MAEKKSRILENIHFERFALATAHRAENVDNLTVFKNIVEAFAENPISVVYPIHPRTKKRIQQSRFLAKIKKSKNMQILPPLGYLDFLVLMKKSEIIVTDSGGVQEEVTAPCIRKPVLVVRLSTERPEAVKAGFAKVVGTQKQILKSIRKTLKHQNNLPATSPYGDGNAAEKIVRIIGKELAF